MAVSGKRCTWVHDSMMVDATGNVYACCHHQPGVVGNIYETPLREIFRIDAGRLRAPGLA